MKFPYGFLFLISLSLLSAISSSVFDISEILKIEYDIVIESQKPLIKEEQGSVEEESNFVFISDVNGMKYRCRLPRENMETSASDDIKEKEENDIGISRSIKSDESNMIELINHLNSCFISYKDNWKYVVCPNHQILQEGAGPVAGIMQILGTYNHTEEADNYVSQYFVDGSYCEAAHANRRTELR